MSQRVQRVALGAAILAVVLVAVALVVTIRRGGAHGTLLIARTMHARNLAWLSADTVDPADGGVRPHPKVASALGLAPGDTLVAISGRPISRPGEVDAVVHELIQLHPAQWFVELSRGGAHVVERWDVEGDVGVARRGRPMWNDGPASDVTPGADDRSADPLLQDIKRVGAARFELPRRAVYGWLARPARLTAGVGSVRRTDRGLELNDVRPGSLAAALGLEDGDVIRAINGDEVAPMDSALALSSRLAHVEQITLDLRRRGAPLILNYMIR